MKTSLRLMIWLGAVLTGTLVLTGATGMAAALNQLTAAEKAAGWRLLFDGQTTQGLHSFKKGSFPAKGWVVEEGWLHCLGKGGGDVVTEAEFEQFELEWEWKQAPGGNSGVKYFVTDTRTSALGHEYQMIDEKQAEGGGKIGGKHLTGSFYDIFAPTHAVAPKPPGEINHSRILVRGNHVEHWLNGTKVLEYDCGSEATKAAVAQSKFKTTEGFGTRLKGHILFQDHNTQAWFRNVKIRDLSGH